LPYPFSGEGRYFCAAAIVKEMYDAVILKYLHIYELGNKNQQQKCGLQ
jgi:hypothetical protein